VVADQLAALSPAAIGMQNPGLLEQMLVARSRQIAVPQTVVTTDPAAARDLLSHKHRLFVKALDKHFIEVSPGRLSGVFPVAVNAPELQSAPKPGPPVIVQEYVEHDAELRVYYVDGQVHGFEVGKETAADPWLAADRVTVQHVELPAPVILATEMLAKNMSLRYGAFDFLLHGETPVFLEVNPDGDWLWAELKAQTAPVTLAVAQMLRKLHRTYRPSLATPSSRGAGIFDLLSFLAPHKGSALADGQSR
jgi:glutathione synthase/RimK-type ligase-like ATP-grasp enzyme